MSRTVRTPPYSLREISKFCRDNYQLGISITHPSIHHEDDIAGRLAKPFVKKMQAKLHRRDTKQSIDISLDECGYYLSNGKVLDKYDNWCDEMDGIFSEDYFMPDYIDFW